jgi:hypothetical protein
MKIKKPIEESCLFQHGFEIFGKTHFRESSSVEESQVYNNKKKNES